MARHPDPASFERRERSRRRAWWLLGAALVAMLLAWAVLDAGPAASTLPTVATPGAATSPPRMAAAESRAPSGAAGDEPRQAELALWQLRLAHAQGTLESYRATSRYPRGAQPLARHPDQADPNRPVEEDHALSPRADGVRLVTAQERVYVQGEETVHFSVAARDASGAPATLRVVRASAREVPAGNAGSLFPVVPLDFNDDGRDGDAASGDGVFGVELRPRAQGFAGLAGQIRVEAILQVGEQQGMTYFDVFYTAEPPAVWAGGVREALVDGSLVLTLPAFVREPGRYVVKARVDDANGAPLALLAFNDELAAGAQDVPLTLFGKLVRDAAPAFPLVVRDVEAFLLRPDTFPDRSLMPRLAGKVHTSGDYPLAAFSDAEWNGEERTRYLEELGRDVARAEAEVRRLAAAPR